MVGILIFIFVKLMHTNMMDNYKTIIISITHEGKYYQINTKSSKFRIMLSSF